MGVFSKFASPQSVQVHALPTGWLFMPDCWIFEGGSPEKEQKYPVYSFLVSHPSGRHVMFDIGLAKDVDAVTPAMQQDYELFFKPIVPKDAHDLLSGGAVSPSSLEAIVFSHVHFDHVGDHRKFPDTPLIVGPGTLKGVLPGWPENPASSFNGSIVSHKGFRELDAESDIWHPVGPFPRAYDYFGDGSFWLVDTPGHMPGHMVALAQTGFDEWVILGGDCCHHIQLLEKNHQTSVHGCRGGSSMHRDLPVALESLGRIQAVNEDETVFVALSHDASLEGRLPLYPESFNGWKESEWKKSIQEARKKQSQRN